MTEWDTQRQCAEVDFRRRQVNLSTSSKHSRSSLKNWKAKTPNNNRSQSQSQSRSCSSSHHVDETESQNVSDASNHVDD